jgi:hypothetical protein
VWSFKHPTIADAISEMLRVTEGMGELYLRGTKSESIVTEAVCIGAIQIPDAVIIPATLDDLLVERLAELPDQHHTNRALFWFLYTRASDAMFRKFFERHPGTFERNAGASYNFTYDPAVLMQARAHALGLLPSKFRYQAATKVEHAIIDDANAELVKHESVL